ncbi:MAG: DUF6438 domain-containing protein [Saprospiraceae bacterium]
MNVCSRNLIYFFCVFCVLAASCNRKTTQKTKGSQAAIPEKEVIVPKPQKDTGVYTVLQIERTICYGNCPVYTATLRSDGKALYVGSRSVELLGTYEAEVGKEQIAEILEKAKQVDFFKFADHYPLNRNNIIADLPYTYTTFCDGMKKKKISDNYDSPENLQWFEKELDIFFNQLTWKKTKD